MAIYTTQCHYSEYFFSHNRNELWKKEVCFSNTSSKMNEYMHASSQNQTNIKHKTKKLKQIQLKQNMNQTQLIQWGNNKSRIWILMVIHNIFPHLISVYVSITALCVTLNNNQLCIVHIEKELGREGHENHKRREMNQKFSHLFQKLSKCLCLLFLSKFVVIVVVEMPYNSANN